MTHQFFSYQFCNKRHLNLGKKYFLSFVGYFRFLGTLLPVGTITMLVPKEPEEKLKWGYVGPYLIKYKQIGEILKKLPYKNYFFCQKN